MIRWLFSLPAVLLYGVATTVLCSVEGTLAGDVGIFQVLAGYLVASTIALWVVRDAERRQRQLPVTIQKGH